MVEKCCKCKSNILPNEGLKCMDCSVVCHIKCVGVVTRNKKWKCESCVLESSSSSSKMGESDRDTANTSVLEAIAAFRNESSSRWDSNNVKLDKLQLDLNGIKTEIGALKQRIDDVATKCAQAGEDVDSLKIENKRLKESTTSYRSILRLTASEDDVVECQEEPRKFIGPGATSVFPRHSYLLKRISSSCDQGHFNGARELRRKGKLMAVWTQDCKVMAKVSQEQRPFRITDLDQVSHLGSSSSTSRKETEEQPTITLGTMSTPTNKTSE
ncbi:hypothetical protein J6590_032344 [Homalodisca vitripennis]|nr:hypothetical protein J6590_032344 [Homalodisca vitripennis]